MRSGLLSNHSSFDRHIKNITRFLHPVIMNAYDNYVARLQTLFVSASNIDPSRICVDQLLEMLTNVNDSTESRTNKARHGVFWASIMASCMGTKSVKMTGQWENFLWTMVALIKHWKPEYKMDFLIHYNMKPWIIRMFSDRKLCPNPYLRLEMLRVIGIWPESYLEDAISGNQAAAGLVVTSAYMELDHIMTVRSHASLFYSLTMVLHTLNKYRHLDAVAAAAVDQVRSLRVGPEASFLNHIVKLLMQKAEATRERYLASSRNILYTVTAFNNIIRLFKLLVVTSPTMVAYAGPGLAQVAAASLVTITSSIVAMRSMLNLKDDNSYLLLLSDLDKLYQALLIPETSTYVSRGVSRVLRLNHAMALSSLNKQVADYGFCFKNFPASCEDSTEECPEEFVDSVTQAVMKSPVLLHSSKMVVDESTLVHLLLVSPSDPFTWCPLDHDSYSRLPDLQADIASWRNTVNGDTSSSSAINDGSCNDSIRRDIVNTDSNSDIEYVIVGHIDRSECQLYKLLMQFVNEL